MANLCASGVLERFPKLRFATIEAGIGWVPWLLDAMDEAYRKHHMWARPKLQGLPSEYFRAHGGATFQEDPAGLALAVIAEKYIGHQTCELGRTLRRVGVDSQVEGACADIEVVLDRVGEHEQADIHPRFIPNFSEEGCALERLSRGECVR